MAKNKVDNIITLSSDDGDIDVEVIDQTVYNGANYLLVADITDDADDGDCYILKDVSTSDSEEANYEVVPDEEADEIFELFSKSVGDDIDLKK